MKFFANISLLGNQILEFVLHKFSNNNSPLTRAGQIGYREDLGKVAVRDASSVKYLATEDYVASNGGGGGGGGASSWDDLSGKPPTFAYTDVQNSYSKAQGFGVATLTDASSIAWNLDNEQVAQVTLGGNRALANPTNIRNGFTYILHIVQDGTGNRTLSYGSAYKFQAGIAPVLSTTSGAVDILTCIARGGVLNCVLTNDFK